MSRIVIGCPIKNRGWILPEYLKALEAIDYHNKEYLMYENDSTDDTLIQLRNHKSASIYNLYSAWPSTTPGSERTEYGKNEYAHLANVRNRFLELFLDTKGDYLLSIDSDIIVHANIINELLPYADSKTIVGAAVCNLPNQKIDGRTACNFMVEYGNVFVHPQGYAPKGLYNAGVIGACYMIPRKAIEDGIRYGPDRQGEDIFWCRQAKVKGYRMIVNLDSRPIHKMVKE